MEKQERTRSVKLIRIGNSKGIRLPKIVIQTYGFCDKILLEETEKGVLLRHKKDTRLSWEQTFKAMAKEKEDWRDFDATLLDGLEED